jgi:hypothetical protein
MTSEMARPGGLRGTFPCVRRNHLIRFFIENLSLFCKQPHSDHGASLNKRLMRATT